MAKLSNEAARRLSLLIPRLASNHDGEVLSTVRAIDRILKAENCDLHDLADAISSNVPHQFNSNPSISQIVTNCLGWQEALNSWEINFLKSIAGRRSISKKQNEVLNRIADKVNVFANARKRRQAC